MGRLGEEGTVDSACVVRRVGEPSLDRSNGSGEVERDLQLTFATVGYVISRFLLCWPGFEAAEGKPEVARWSALSNCCQRRE